MRIERFACLAALVFAVACSEDESRPSPISSETSSNQPTAPVGGAAGAGGATGAAGAAGTSPTPAGGGASSTEGSDDDIDLDPGAPVDPGGSSTEADAAAPAPAEAVDAGASATGMSFFVTSRGTGNGGNFGGLAGADAFCTSLVAAVSPELATKTWRAYLSTTAENARDRIGAGPWRNAAGVVIGTNVAQLHDQSPGPLNMATGAASEATYPFNDASTALDETGAQVPNNPVLHDILTGTNLDGTASATGTCSDWTSTAGRTTNGHSNRTGFGTNFTSWNSAHDTGCGEPDPGANFQQNTVSEGGGRGSIYCFAID